MMELDNIECTIRLLKEDHKELFGEGSVPRVTTHTPMLRPYSIVVKARLEWKDRSKGVYIKVPLNPDDADMVKELHEEYMQLNWFNKRFPLESGYAVVRPLRLYDEYNALVTEEAEGIALDLLTKKHGKGFHRATEKLSAHYRRCGEWLRVFQSLKVSPFCRPYQADEVADFVIRQVGKCADGGLLDSGLLSGISSFVNEVARRRDVMDCPIVPMHSDFIPSNIIVCEEVITALDFVALRVGPAYRDVATFLTTLDGVMVNPFFRSAIIEGLKREFLKGYRWDPEEEKGLIFNIFEIREILCRTLQLSQRLNGIKSKIMYQRMHVRLERRLCEIIGD